MDEKDRNTETLNIYYKLWINNFEEMKELLRTPSKQAICPGREW